MLQNLKSLFFTLMALMQTACLHVPEAVDAAPAAAEVHDLSVMFQGCNHKPTEGYLFCKLTDGAAVEDTTLRIYAPLETCQRDSCFTFQFLRRDGSLGYSGSIPHDKSFVDVGLSNIIDHTGTLLKTDAGEYQVMIRLWWIDPNAKIEKTSRADGLVRLWLVDKDAQFLACEDPQTGWKLPVPDMTCRYDLSTGFRVSMCGKDCER